MKKGQDVSLVGVVILLVSILKFLNLKGVPFFGDEALYCYLGYKFANEAFIDAWNLTVNYWKVAPLTSILQGVALKSGVSPIIACRTVSVIAGAVSAAAVFFIVKKLSKQIHIRWAALGFILLNPFSFFSQRTALQEPILTAFVSLSVLFLIQKNKLKGAMSFLLAFLSKLNALLIVPGFILFKGGIVSFLIAGVLVLLSSKFTNLWETVGYHTSETFSLVQILKRLINNLYLMRSWYLQYLTPLFYVSLFLGMWNLYKDKLYKWILWPGIILLGYGIVIDGFFPRYLLLTLPLLTIIVAYSAKNFLGKAVLLLMLLVFVQRDVDIVFYPEKAMLAREDKFQFFEDWSSGVGVPETIYYIQKRYEKATVFLPEDLYFRFYLYSLDMNMMQAYQSGYENENLTDNLYIGTSYHSKQKRELDDKYSLERVFSSNENWANSMILYEIN